jgi:hypothetical protein
MTPHDVVARARELEGQEVVVTVRGVVQRYTGENWGVRRPSSGLFAVSLTDNGRAVDDLVDIQPAPLRIEPGELYQGPGVPLSRGQADGSLHLLDRDEFINPDIVRRLDGLHRVKVVPA